MSENIEQVKLDYQLLDRLRTDCEYFLGAGNRNLDKLWAKSVEEQIEKMRDLYDNLPEKPEWLTPEQIDEYEAKMLDAMSSKGEYRRLSSLKKCHCGGTPKITRDFGWWHIECRECHKYPVDIIGATRVYGWNTRNDAIQRWEACCEDESKMAAGNDDLHIPGTGKEFDYMVSFVTGTEEPSETFFKQLKALWTAYCLHENIMLDTIGYNAASTKLEAVICRHFGIKGRNASAIMLPSLANGQNDFWLFMDETLG